MNRIDRLHAILTHLQSKKKVTAQEVADRFNISLRTVYRDVKALEESGVPVIGEAGSGYTIMEGYRLPPVMFTQEEAAALLLGAKLTAHQSDQSVKKHFNAALYKIKAVLRTSDKEHMDQLDDNIAVLSHLPDNDTNGRYLVDVQKALGDRRVIQIRYQSGNEAVTNRRIEPIGLCYYGQAWHLIGWCQLRNGYRDFRVSRIQHLEIFDTIFDPDSHPSLREYLDTMTSTSDLQEVVIRIPKRVSNYQGSQKYYYGFVREEVKDEYVYQYYLTAHPEYLGRWFLMYTHLVTIVSPASLHAIMRSLAEEVQRHYLQPEPAADITDVPATVQTTA